ncbi:uncharacterized protein BDZ83DRAFT_608351 [Colletotrichum acutatum]|uniref:Secreted protein n=1 Tax=Glomerella acutata TaxID=27357 RepID=A0AAD8XK37_GLOAC|nr:uncharacterized protein BDZ83DRAFT_608351 [Colletotrichum acutatum]KAK1728836.1 hypothetical protein BDZ83DRAFT_608351 [Colletotrichum acutatum]
MLLLLLLQLELAGREVDLLLLRLLLRLVVGAEDGVEGEVVGVGGRKVHGPWCFCPLSRGGVWVGLHNWRAAVVSEMVALLSCSLRFSVLPGERSDSAGARRCQKRKR